MDGIYIVIHFYKKKIMKKSVALVFAMFIFSAVSFSQSSLNSIYYHVKEKETSALLIVKNNHPSNTILADKLVYGKNYKCDEYDEVDKIKIKPGETRRYHLSNRKCEYKFRIVNVRFE